MAQNRRRSTARGPQNMFRFMPGRVPTPDNDKILFHGLRYSRNAVKDLEKGFLAGVGIGPGQHLPKDGPGVGFKLSDGGVIVPAMPTDDLKTVGVRDYTPPGQKRARQYVDFATFKAIGKNMLNLVPYEEDKVAYGEMWTGDHDQSEGAYQLIQANLFAHGSVAFSGGTVIVDAKAKKKGDKKSKKAGSEVPEDERGVRGSGAEMIGETSGLVVAGIPLWTARVFRIKYSSKDSEAVLVRQHKHFFLVLMENEKPNWREVPAEIYKPHFERLMGDELTKLLAPQAEKVAGQVLGTVAA